MDLLSLVIPVNDLCHFIDPLLHFFLCEQYTDLICHRLILRFLFIFFFFPGQCRPVACRDLCLKYAFCKRADLIITADAVSDHPHHMTSVCQKGDPVPEPGWDLFIDHISAQGLVDSLRKSQIVSGLSGSDDGRTLYFITVKPFRIHIFRNWRAFFVRKYGKNGGQYRRRIQCQTENSRLASQKDPTIFPDSAQPVGKLDSASRLPVKQRLCCFCMDQPQILRRPGQML